MNNTEDNIVEKMEIPPIVPNRRKVKRIDNNFFKQFIICFVCVILLALFVYRDEIKTALNHTKAKDTAHARWDLNLPFHNKRQNILLLGIDVGENKENIFDNTRADSIFLVSIQPQVKSINVISIPRDSKVYIHSRSNPDKINHAFVYGGVETMIKTVEQTLGVRVDHHLVVSNQALIDFIDKIGGIDVYVEKDMHYDDYTAKLHINLKKGVRHLNGKEAEGFMRFRKDALGDIGRIRRQQWFLNALSAKLKDPAVIIKMPEILKSVSQYIQTDFSFYELAQYAALIKSTDLSKIKVATLPGEPSQRGFISYWILDPKGVQDVVDRLVYGDRPKTLNRPLEIGILYVESQENKALQLQKKLEELNYTVNLKQVKILGNSHIAVHNLDIPTDAVSGLRHQVPQLKKQQTVYDMIGINKAARDLTIVLAGS